MTRTTLSTLENKHFINNNNNRDKINGDINNKSNSSHDKHDNKDKNNNDNSRKK